MVCQLSENLGIAPEVVRIIKHQRNLVRGRMPEMEFGFWQLCSAEWLLLGTRFCASLLSCGCSVYFFLTWFLFFSEIFSFLQFSVLNLTLRQLHVVFPVEKPASSSLCLVSVCRQVWKASCSTAVGQAERVLGRKCWFYRHWCTDQHSRGVVTLWAHRVQTLLPAVLVSSLGISSSAPHVASWWINGAWWGKTGLFTWLEVCDHGQGHSVSRCYFRAFTVIGSIWLWANIRGYSEEGGSGGIVCAINITGQWAVLVLETVASNVTQRNFVYLIPCV